MEITRLFPGQTLTGAGVPMSTPPLVSVAMAVYNSESYVAEAIASILSQNFTDFEFLIINDGSTDNSAQILEHYARQDKRIRLIHRENRGVPFTRNQLLAQTNAEFIAVMDSDDVALPDRLADQVAFLQRSPETVWVGGAFELIDQGGRYITRIEMPETNTDIQRLLVEGHTSFIHPTAMIRRDALVRVGGYDETLRVAHDLDLWLKLSEVGELANLKQPVLQYRIHPDSICNQNQSKALDEVQTCFDRAWKRRGIQTRFQATRVCGWRPTADPASRYEFMLKYGWWGFLSRQRGTARHYGLRAVRLNPFDAEGWKLLTCALIKPLPQPTEP